MYVRAFPLPHAHTMTYVVGGALGSVGMDQWREKKWHEKSEGFLVYTLRIERINDIFTFWFRYF